MSRDSTFTVFDPYLGGYYKNFAKRVAHVGDAKTWKTLRGAVEFASLQNVSRNIPPGQEGKPHKYRDVPNCVVHEHGPSGMMVAEHPAPPQYINLITRTGAGRQPSNEE